MMGFNINGLCKRSMVLLVFLFATVAVHAQEITVSGTVISGKTEKTLAGVNISVKGTTAGTFTDKVGAFKLAVPSRQDTLIFSFVGYEKRTVPIQGRAELGKIELIPKTNQLEQMVVVGYGEQKKRDLTGSVASISQEDLNQNAVVSNVGEALQGRVSGVSIKQNSGAPGGSVDIRIRGNNSISSSDGPLYVIDGFPMDNGQDIDPSQIKNIEVLKSASATAIYGSRGANGVILITTKSGQAGKNTITYNVKTSIQRLKNPFDLLNAQSYKLLQNDLYQEIAGQENVKYGVYSPSQLKSNVNTDWVNATTRIGKIQNHELQFSGGTDKTQVFSSLGFFNNQGVLKNTKFRRISGRINIHQKINDFISANANISGNRENSNFQNYNGSIRSSNIIYSVLTYSPAVPIYNEDGSFGRPPGGKGDNPLANLLLRQNESQNDKLIGNAAITLDPIPGLEAKIRGGADIYNNKVNQYLPKSSYQGSIDNGDASKSVFDQNHYLVDATVNYDKDINENNSFKILGGYSYESFNEESSGISASGFPTDSYTFNNLGAASKIKGISSYKGEHILNSYFGRVNYSYEDKYLFTFTLRRDGSSRFGSNNKWGTFPSGAFAWRISDEPFISKINFISNLKLRMDYGVTGNDRIGNYGSYGLLNTGHVTFDGSSSSIGTYLDASSPPNPDLRWETTSQYNVGIDLGLFDGRVAFTANAYYKKTSNLLVNIDLPLYSGYSSGLKNTGKIRNKGLEFSIQSKNVRSSSFNWNTNLNFALNRNRVVSLGDRKNPILLSLPKPNGLVSSEKFSIIKEGEPLGSLYGYVYEGVIQKGENYNPEPNAQPGDPKFKDVNGDGKITPDDRTILGSAYPDFTFGLQNQFFYKNFNLSISLYGSLGNDLLNVNRINLEWKRSTKALNRWTPSNTDTDIPRNGFYYSQYGGYVNSHFVENASYLRLQNIRFGYDLPIHNSALRTLRIYFSAENLLTLTNYSGWSPETDTNKYEQNKAKHASNVTGVATGAIKSTGSGGYRNANAGAGVDFNSYPSMRTYTLGIKISL